MTKISDTVDRIIGRKQSPPGGTPVKIEPTFDMSVSLTEEGRKKAEGMMLPSPLFEVASAISEAGGTATYREIAQAPGVKFPVSKIEAICHSMVRSGYLKPNKVSK